MPETARAQGPPTAESYARMQRASTVFTPSSPIIDQELFAGRVPQISKVMDAVNQSGQHAILYGERGVGKTSLANILAPIAQAINPGMVSAKVNCDTTDTFSSAWKKALGELRFTVTARPAGFTAEVQQRIASLAERLPENCSPNDVRSVLASVNQPIVLVFDEFDRLQPRAARVFTDLIKMLSDYSSAATIVLVGVATTIEQLIKDHASIERALVQIPMPRMERAEILQILNTGAGKLEMSFEPTAAQQIVSLSQGRPHYTHSIGLYSVRHALMTNSLVVMQGDVDNGVAEAVKNAHESLKTQYHTATASSHKSALFAQVLLACALALKDQRSYFRAADVQEPLSAIMGKKFDVPAFARHLSEFCNDSRSNVLERTGQSRRFRYRFTNPLIQPYVVMSGLTTGLITPAKLSALSTH
jgi:Cdc6-like AAA superfamily ATPase